MYTQVKAEKRKKLIWWPNTILNLTQIQTNLLHYENLRDSKQNTKRDNERDKKTEIGAHPSTDGSELTRIWKDSTPKAKLRHILTLYTPHSWVCFF